jgi:hypothetical protein
MGSPVAMMSDSLLKALKIFVVVAAVVIVAGTATLIWLLVKRGTSTRAARAPATPSVPAHVALPPGGEVTAVSLTGSQLVLLGTAPGEGQFVLVVDLASGERRRLLQLVPERP